MKPVATTKFSMILGRVLSLIVLVLSVATTVHAKTIDEDFDALIEENAANQKRLSQALQQQLKTKDLGKTVNPNFHKVGESVLGKNSSENVAVETDSGKRTRNQKTPDLEKKNFHRISQELKDVK